MARPRETHLKKYKIHQQRDGDFSFRWCPKTNDLYLHVQRSNKQNMINAPQGAQARDLAHSLPHPHCLLL